MSNPILMIFPRLRYGIGTCTYIFMILEILNFTEVKNIPHTFFCHTTLLCLCSPSPQSLSNTWHSNLAFVACSG